MLANQLGQFKHAHLLRAAEENTELVVGIDHALVLLVL